MTYPLILVLEAELELLEAAKRHDEIREGLGDDFIENVDAALNRICRVPRQSPIVLGTARVALVERFPYIVVYEFAFERIRVLAIQHSHRDPEAWQKRVD